MNRFDGTVKQGPHRDGRIWSRLAVATVVVFALAGPLAAQESTELTPEEEQLLIEQAMQRSFEGEVTVTGSLIPRADLTALSPVSILEIPTELTYSGTVRIEDLVRTMPQAFAGQNSTIANGTTGTATVDLRQLGPARTLVLINGRRLPPGNAWFSPAPDINVVPAPLVKRVDVLTGGASTTYGSDAVSGVVNFVMDTDFEGVRGGVQYGGFYHDNNNETAQRINAESEFDYPTGYDFDGEAVNANIAVGGKFADGKGHAAAYIDYRKIEGLFKGQRDYLNCSVAAGDDGPFCGGSGTNPAGRFRPFRADGSTYTPRDYSVEGNQFVADFPLFNYAPYVNIQRPDEKWNAGVFANYEINKHFDVYMEVMYMNNDSTADIAPSGNFNNVAQINCDNPMLSPQQHDLLCGPDSGYGPTDYAQTWIFRRNVEGGPRQYNDGHTNIRMLAGVRGAIGENWKYDFYYMNGQNNQSQSFNEDLNVTRIANALDVIEDPDTGEWVCRNDAGNGCVPWNIFVNNGNQLVDDPRQGVTQAAIDYMTTISVAYGVTSVEVINLTLTSDWENYGIAIPGASEGVQAAIGAEYREESMVFTPDEIYQTGAAGSGGGTLPIDGGYNVTEGFIELLVPIVQDVKGAQDLSLELGYRYSDYSTAGGVSTYKGQLSYAPTGSWRLRGGYNRAIRAANLFELFRPQGYNLSGSTDICAGPTPTATLEQCIRTGVLPEQYGFIAESPAQQYNTLEGGNPLLDPEVADTLTAGVVWTPQGIRGLSITLDYYQIDIEEAIGSLGADDIIQQCANTGDPLLCSLIHRDNQGTLWATPAGYTETTNQNIGLVEAEGIDLNANYLFGLGGAGYLAVDLMGTYVLDNTFTNPLVSYSCVGYFGLQCGGPVPEWRHRFRATWESNFRLNLSLAWRYLGGTDNDDASSDPDLGDPEAMPIWEVNDIAEIEPYNWFDLAASYTLRNGLKFTLGINNVLDEEPPLAPDHADQNIVNLYAQYEPAGRYIFGSVQFNF